MISELAGRNKEGEIKKKGKLHREKIIDRGVKAFSENFARDFKSIGTLLESNDKDEQYVGACTSIVMKNHIQIGQTRLGFFSFPGSTLHIDFIF